MAFLGIKSKREKEAEAKHWDKELRYANIVLPTFLQRDEVKRFNAITTKSTYENYRYGNEVRDAVIKSLIELSVVPAIMALNAIAKMKPGDWVKMREYAKEDRSRYVNDIELKNSIGNAEDYLIRTMAISFDTVMDAIKKMPLEYRQYTLKLYERAGGTVPEEYAGDLVEKKGWWK